MQLASDKGDDFPALRSLQLTEPAFASLRTQGFVSAERRAGKLNFKLRYRHNGRQHVRGLGHDRRSAEAIKGELLVLQREVHAQRKFAQLARMARKLRKSSKTTLHALLEENGFHFHGQAIRKQRQPKSYH
jgi:hypothetical protein